MSHWHKHAGLWLDRTNPVTRYLEIMQQIFCPHMCLQNYLLKHLVAGWLLIHCRQQSVAVLVVRHASLLEQTDTSKLEVSLCFCLSHGIVLLLSWQTSTQYSWCLWSTCEYIQQCTHGHGVKLFHQKEILKRSEKKNIIRYGNILENKARIFQDTALFK